MQKTLACKTLNILNYSTSTLVTHDREQARLKTGLLKPVISGGSPARLPAPKPRQGVRKGAEGQALVEFALTLPFLILLLVVLVELGLLIRSHMTVTAAV